MSGSSRGCVRNSSGASIFRSLLLVLAVQKPFGLFSSPTTSAPVLVKAVSAENCISVPTCQLHQNPMAQYEYLTGRSQGRPHHLVLDEHFDSIEEA